MSIINDLVKFLTENNYGPAYKEQVVTFGEELTPPCRAFYIEPTSVGMNPDLKLTYETVNGDVITKHASTGFYHPVKVKRFVGFSLVGGLPADLPILTAIW